MKLGIVYHMPCWQTSDGAIWEAEGSFARYVDSMAPYADEISLCVPVPTRHPDQDRVGTRVKAANVRLAALPYFDGPRAFYPQLFSVRRRLRGWVDTVDVVNCRVPTPAGWFAFKAARRANKPVVLLIVGDLRAVAPTLPYRGIKRMLFDAYTAFEERAVRRMAIGSVTFANGGDLAAKHRQQGAHVTETRTTTITAADINTRLDTCQRSPVRILTVSRIDPRKQLRCLPDAVACLQSMRYDVALDIIGPEVGRPGAAERAAIERAVQEKHLADRVRCLGAIPLESLLPLYRTYDLFVLPTGPGEGIPRVLLEAMAAGLPIVTTRVAGIPSLITHDVNGVLLEQASSQLVAEALRRLIEDPLLRRRLIQGGYETARAHTLERQAAEMMTVVAGRTGLAFQSPLSPRGMIA